MKAKTTISMFLKIDLQHGKIGDVSVRPLLIEMSPIGLKHTCAMSGPMSAFEGDADIAAKNVNFG